ncbi:NIPSNAP family protein [Bacillus cereus]|uniref:NIPSNAP family protein n=1 Tax=Bacillus thuringiensis TaxID=1428 RepID=A0AAW9JBE1_BACTU|nr:MULTISPECIES: NIPSNAP family protein [Bacillus cereus group]MCU4936759.1 NIPSNAP family protein [Bacillus cereus]MCU5185862.1 NIPSNAP family protein [Bacillus cereus]MDZ5478567.1 NIPSNAP family protein [Bacillus thuringiensis]MRB33972.1 cytoplasmic protein [Bacillus thuringiensis]TKH84994.1 cytoplasmic protein [Bacillus cereus]
MFYRRKYYVVKNEFIEVFNNHFNNTNLPNQLKHGSRLIGRWMKDNKNSTSEVFAIWEYDSFERYKEIESKIRSEEIHVKRIHHWYEKHGGREYVLQKYIVEMKNEELVCTVK